VANFKSKLDKDYRGYLDEIEQKTKREIETLNADVEAAKEEAEKAAKTIQPAEIEEKS
jgi:hypothetical protein